jgi:hypothetical protein
VSAPDLGVGGPAAGGDPALEVAVRRAGLAALIGGRCPTPADLAVAAGSEEDAVAPVLAALVAGGRATLTPDGRLDGIAGVTTRSTRHAIVWTGGRCQTWCAFDAVAIPAAFGWTATAVTTCGWCGADLGVALGGGVPEGDAWGWLPPGDCEHVLRDFCAAADLYCDRAHLDAWRAAAGDPPGEPHPVSVLADIGREAWADCRPMEEGPAGAGPSSCR